MNKLRTMAGVSYSQAMLGKLYLKQLSLRDFIVLSESDIVNQINKDYNYLSDLKKEIDDEKFSISYI